MRTALLIPQPPLRSKNPIDKEGNERIMYQQDVQGKKISPLIGAGMILLIVVSIIAAGILEQIIAQLTGMAFGAMLVWALVVLEVFMLFRLSVREYRYTLADGRLFIEACYGSSTRIIHDIALSSMLAIGPEEEIFSQYANGQTFDKVFTKGCSISPSVIAYRKEEEIKLLLFQPDEQLAGMIRKELPADENR